MSILIKFIAEHGCRAVPLGSDKFLCEEQFAGESFPDTANEFYGPYWTPVPATKVAVRNWLGY
ncbi:MULTISPECIES: hypothetical protein [Burkholderia]|nr:MULTISPECIES: hypothetical protein [Burkholderia]